MCSINRLDSRGLKVRASGMLTEDADARGEETDRLAGLGQEVLLL